MINKPNYFLTLSIFHLLLVSTVLNNSSCQSFGGNINYYDIIQKYNYYPVEWAQSKTYRPNFEKVIQGASVLASTITRNSNAESNNSNGGITGFIGRSVQTILSPVKYFINYDKIHVIFPGTRWCGEGNISTDSQEFGVFESTDKCCKQHDHCPLSIIGGSTLGPLKNDGLFTRSWCPCDLEFYYCLKETKNPIAREIGTTYFTFLGPQCIDYGYPIVSCLERGGKRIIDRKCIKYRFDTTKNLTLQWYDNLDF